jgi:hypothetical protein
MSMNIFRLAGDMSHVFSIIVLLLRLRVAKNAQGAIFLCWCCIGRIFAVDKGSHLVYNRLEC